jgi:uncharacterized protein YqgV (UPF0045/DUF77 family)
VAPPPTTLAPSPPKKGSAEEPLEAAGKRTEGVSQLHVTVQLSLQPKRPGLSITESRAACERVLAGSGFPVKFEDDAARVEGDWDTVLRAAHRCYRLVDRMGSARLTATVRLPGPVDELVAWEESEVLEDARDVPVGPPLLSKNLAYVEGGE